VTSPAGTCSARPRAASCPWNPSPVCTALVGRYLPGLAHPPRFQECRAPFPPFPGPGDRYQNLYRQHLPVSHLGRRGIGEQGIDRRPGLVAAVDAPHAFPNLKPNAFVESETGRDVHRLWPQLAPLTGLQVFRPSGPPNPSGLCNAFPLVEYQYQFGGDPPNAAFTQRRP
jgi:hypothetical protein